MLLRGTLPLENAAKAKRAIAGFSIYGLEGAQAVCRAAERADVAVLIQAGSSAFRQAGRESLARVALAEAEASAAAVGVHLDHSTNLEEIAACLELGYTSVMYDGSKLSFEENVRMTAQAVGLARPFGAWVEAELGAIAGDEDRSLGAESGTLTDPEQARRFVEETGVDALAVAVGNVHGFAPAGTRLDLGRLGEIAELCPVPIVLHGASGVAREEMIGAIERGAVKFNVNTELRRAVIDAFAAQIETAQSTYDLASLLTAGREAMADVATEVARLLARQDVPTGVHLPADRGAAAA